MQIEGWNGAIGGAQWWARALGFSALIGAIVALLGPYGSYYNDLSLRLIDWITILLLGTLILGFSVPPMIGWGTRAGLPRPFAFAIALAIAAIPAAAASAAISKIFWARHVADYRWSDWYLQTLLIASITVLLWGVMEIARWSRRHQSPPPAVTNAATGEVICLQMEDHYVRVHRDTRSTLELMPLHEAIRRYGSADGLQVHRGWWVAGGGVEAAERDVRNWRLRLRNGVTVPIARNRIGDVRRRGWLNPR